MKYYLSFFISFFSTIAALEIQGSKTTLALLSLSTTVTAIIAPRYLKWFVPAALIAITTFHLHQPNLKSPSHISFFQNTNQTLVATITDIDERHSYSFLTVSNIQINSQKIQDNILIKTSRHPKFKYYDQITIEGQIQAPKPSQNFNYPKYLALKKVYGQMNYPQISTPTPSRSLLKPIHSLRLFIEKQFNKSLPEPHASFIAGLLIGSRRGLPKELLNHFQTTGLTHIIAISGYNITLLILFINKSLYFLSRKNQTIAAAILIIFFTILVGASAAVVRAAIMGIISLLAIANQRQSLITLALLWSGFFMTLFNPLTLIYDVGFQLSFLAVLSLIYIFPIIELKFNFIKSQLLKEGLLTTIAAQVLVLPILLTNFNQLSLISPIANLLVAPLLPISMIGGLGLFICSILLPPLSIIFQTITWLALSIIIKITEITASIPYASLKITWFNSWHTISYFLLMLFIITQPKLRNNKS